MKDKIVTADEAISLVRDRDTLSSCGFVQSCVPEALLKALERRYLKTGSPRNLSLFATAGQGDSKTKGLSRLGHEGLLRKVVAGNWGRMPSVCQLALMKNLPYNLPQGIIAQLFRDLAGGKPGTFSKIGLHTFVDPRHSAQPVFPASSRPARARHVVIVKMG
jgi:propionate CoA-transferase